ncbi:MAG: neutral/alkaline non-lysosomal ceramidase N-terminal domain-containing protein [Candidatus Sumerlaeota bacterium]|nr:neutral/alkaline non-lysosomal ceramidase N-terminal domain-containing protein [Candidatus Sumerlaeota bacterium]
MSESSQATHVCKAGNGRAVLTPPLGVKLAGYFHERIAKTVRDDLYARALAIENGGRRVALVSCDLIAMCEEVSAAAKQMIERECGIPPENVLICATHTHTGPEIRPAAVMPRTEEYSSSVPRRIADAVRSAHDSLFEATLHPGRTEAHGYAFNRLHRRKDGSEVFGLPQSLESVIAPAGPIDPELQTLTVRDREGRIRAMAVNHALHPDVIGGGAGDFISADWPGVMARTIATIYGDDVDCLFLQGTAGDVNHRPHAPTYMPVNGPRKAEQIGRALAGAAMYSAERAEPMDDLTLEGAMQVISIPYYTRDAALAEEVKRLRAAEKLGPMDKHVLERFETWPYDGKDAAVPIQTLRIGEVGIVGLPAEIFVRIGLEIKQYSPARFTFPVELANANVSTYVPALDQAERGAYGARPILSRWLCADAGRRMSDAALKALHEMWDRG